MIFGDELAVSQTQTITREQWLRDRAESDEVHVVQHDVQAAWWDQ